MRLLNQMNLNELHAAYLKDPLSVDAFATSLRDFVIKIVKTECKRHSASTYDTIEDAVGESLLEVWRQLDRYERDKCLFTTNVTTIVLRNIVDIYRKCNKRQEIELHDETGVVVHDERSISRITYRNLLGRLNNGDKLFVKYKIEGLSDDDIAANFGQNRQWAWNKWYRIKEKLRVLAAAGE
jgi:RNA polymerase sigma factor (sigma-70 family)